MSVADLAPFPGGQTAFLSTPADFAVFGGLAGPGKTTALLLDPLRFLKYPGKYRVAIFRREAMAKTEAGGLADKAAEIYSQLGATYRAGADQDFRLKYGKAGKGGDTVVGGVTMPTEGGGTLRIQLAHLPKENDKLKWQGAELDAVCFDEIAHFTETQVFYLISRLRRSNPANVVEPYARGTMNPEPGGWLRDMMDWWIGRDGFPIEERGGRLRYFARLEADEDDAVGGKAWADTAEELEEHYPGAAPMSFTFIPAKHSDNPAVDWEEYRVKLANQPSHVEAQLWGGDWNASPPTPGKIYRVPQGVLFELEDPDFRAFLAANPRPQQLGAWDYGVSAHGLQWAGGLIEAGAPPTLWICHALDLTGLGGVEAGRERMARGSGLPELGIDSFAWQQDTGDPSGEAEAASDSWASTLHAAGVPLMPVYHFMTEDGRKFYFNSQAGREKSFELAQVLMDGCPRGRIRIGAWLRAFVRDIRAYQRMIPEGMDPSDWRTVHARPKKDKASHAGDVLSYLAAFYWQTVQTELAQRERQRPGEVRHRKPSPGRQAREAVAAMSGAEPGERRRRRTRVSDVLRLAR